MVPTGLGPLGPRGLKLADLLRQRDLKGRDAVQAAFRKRCAALFNGRTERLIRNQWAQDRLPGLRVREGGDKEEPERGRCSFLLQLLYSAVRVNPLEGRGRTAKAAASSVCWLSSALSRSSAAATSSLAVLALTLSM